MAELTVSWRITPGSEFSKVTSNAKCPERKVQGIFHMPLRCLPSPCSRIAAASAALSTSAVHWAARIPR